MPTSDVADDPATRLAAALRSLHVEKGAPSVRALAGQIGDVSHTTVADALAGRRVPSWSVLAGIVRALDGDQEQFQRLWADTRERADPGSHPGSQRTVGLPETHTSPAEVRILLVEDEPAWLELISQALPGYQVDMASSYNQAAELLQDEGRRYDVALVDLNLMDSDLLDAQDQLGGEVLRLLQSSSPATLRIAVTGRPPGSVRTFFHDLDVDDLLLKGSMTLADVRRVVAERLALARHQPDSPSATSPREPGAQ